MLNFSSCKQMTCGTVCFQVAAAAALLADKFLHVVTIKLWCENSDTIAGPMQTAGTVAWCTKVLLLSESRQLVQYYALSSLGVIAGHSTKGQRSTSYPIDWAAFCVDLPLLKSV